MRKTHLGKWQFEGSISLLPALPVANQQCLFLDMSCLQACLLVSFVWCMPGGESMHDQLPQIMWQAHSVGLPQACS
jgi:hypothetical protein